MPVSNILDRLGKFGRVPPFHVTAGVRPFRVVGDEVVFHVPRYLLRAPAPLISPHDAAIPVQRRALYPLHLASECGAKLLPRRILAWRPVSLNPRMRSKLRYPIVSDKCARGRCPGWHPGRRWCGPASGCVCRTGPRAVSGLWPV